MNELFTNVSIGIISGIITSIIIFLFLHVYQQIIKGYIENLLYKDIMISGKWKTKAVYPHGNEIEEIVEMKQSAHKVNGTIRLESDEYAFKGEFKNMILTSTYWNSNISDRDRGTFTLECKKNGSVLEGYAALFVESKDGSNIL